MSDETKVIKLHKGGSPVPTPAEEEEDAKGKHEEGMIAALHRAIADGGVRAVILYQNEEGEPGIATYPQNMIVSDALGMVDEAHILIDEGYRLRD